MSTAALKAGPALRRGSALRRRRLSSVLRDYLRRPLPTIRIADLVDLFGDRAFGALLLIFAIPNLIPMPVNASAILGIPLILIAGQLATGRRALWLPTVVRTRGLGRTEFCHLVDRITPALRRTERLLAPRLPVFLSPFGERLIGLMCLILSVILFLPIPFGNWLPAFSICLFALALLQKDGLAALIGWLSATASLAVVAAVAGGAFLAVKTGVAYAAGYLGL